MGDEPKKDGPIYAATTRLPKVEVPQNQVDAILQEVRALRLEQQDSHKELKADIGLVTSELNVVKGSVQNLQEWRGLVDEKLQSNSMRAKEPSQHDVEIRAELKAEKDAREALAADVSTIKTSMTTNTDATLALKKELVDGVKSFWKRHPKLETALVALIVAAAGVAYTALTHGGHLP